MYFAPNVAVDEDYLALGYAALKKKNDDGDDGNNGGDDNNPTDTTKFKLTYSINGGTGNDVVVEVEEGGQVTVASNSFTAPTNKSFKGWNDSASGDGQEYAVGATIVMTGDMTLYAIWEPVMVKVIYRVNGGSGSAKTVEVEKGSDYTIEDNMFTAPQYQKFATWNTNKSGKSTNYKPGDVYTANKALDLYAIWVDDLVTLLFDENGGTGKVEPTEYVRGKAEILVADPTGIVAPEGKKFKEWNTSKDGTGTAYQNGEYVTPADDMTFYAIWEDE